MKQPPEFWIGSTKIAATVSGSSKRIISSARLAAQIPNSSSVLNEDGARYQLVFGILNVEGTSGSNIFFMAGIPVIESAPWLVPW